MSTYAKLSICLTMGLALFFGVLYAYFPESGQAYERLHVFLFNLVSGGTLLLHFTEGREGFGWRQRIYFILAMSYSVCAAMGWYLPVLITSVPLVAIVEMVRIRHFGFLPFDFFRRNVTTGDKFKHAALLCLSLAVIIADLIIVNNEYVQIIQNSKMTIDIFFLGYSFPLSLATMSIMFSFMHTGERSPSAWEELSFWLINLGVIAFFVFIILGITALEIACAVTLFATVLLIFWLFIKKAPRRQQKTYLLSGMGFLVLTGISGIFYLLRYLEPSFAKLGGDLLSMHASVSLYGWNLTGLLIILRLANFPIRLNSAFFIGLHWLVVVVLLPLGAFQPAFWLVALPLFFLMLGLVLFSKDIRGRPTFFDCFTRESFFSVPRQALFAFHEKTGAFEKLAPPAGVEVIRSASSLEPSEERVVFTVHFWRFRFVFEMKHTVYDPPELFVDEQVKGPFSFWTHRHEFSGAGSRNDPASTLRDKITYGHPLLFLLRPFVRRRLKRLFTYRHRLTANEVHASHTNSDEKKRVVLTGATGLIGRRICAILEEKGYKVIALVRNPERAHRILGGEIDCRMWNFDDPGKNDWKDSLAGAAGVIHLAGTPLFAKRWTSDYKLRMKQSRIRSTRMLVEAIGETSEKPPAFVSASAIGIYGTRPDLEVSEETPPANDFLANICLGWEAEARKLDEQGVRNMQVRIGIVLSSASGALKEFLLPFRLGIGGPFGNADCWLNWIHLEDIARIFVMCIQDETMHGAYNACAPNPVNMGQFADTLGQVLDRPSLMRYPTWLLKPLIGEAARYVSGGPKVDSNKVRRQGYEFFFDDLEESLRNILMRPEQEIL